MANTKQQKEILAKLANFSTSTPANKSEYNEKWVTMEKREIKIDGATVTCDSGAKKYMHYTAAWIDKNKKAGAKSGDHYWIIKFGNLEKDHTLVGISSKHYVKKGWGTRGLMYGEGNLSNGVTVLSARFGDVIASGDTVGILLHFPTILEKEKRMHVYLFHNGRPLGLAFEVPFSTFHKELFPIIMFSRGRSSASIYRESMFKVPPFFQIRRPKIGNMGMMGPWVLGAALFFGPPVPNLKALEYNLKIDIYERGPDCYEIYLDDFVPRPKQKRSLKSKSKANKSHHHLRDSKTESWEVKKAAEDKTWTLVNKTIEEDNARRPYTVSYDLILANQPPPYRHLRYTVEKIGPEEVEIIKYFQQPDSVEVNDGYLKIAKEGFTAIFVPRDIEVEPFKGKPFDLKHDFLDLESATDAQKKAAGVPYNQRPSIANSYMPRPSIGNA